MDNYQRSQHSRVQELHRRGDGSSLVRRPPLVKHESAWSPEGADPRRDLPWNDCNAPLDQKTAERWLATAGIEYAIKDMRPFHSALTHPSYTRREWPGMEDTPPGTVPLAVEDYERLEFLGDSVLNTCVVDVLREMFPHRDQGFLTKLKIRLVCGSQLAIFTQHIGMQKHVLLSWAAEHEGCLRDNLKVLEDVFESFLGALFLDSGRDYVLCYRLVNHLLERTVNMTEMEQIDTNYKDQLLRYYAAHFHGSTPRYHEIETPQTGRRGLFVMGVLAPPTSNGAGRVIIAVGEHKNKKRAEQMASKKALAYFGVTFDAPC